MSNEAEEARRRTKAALEAKALPAENERRHQEERARALNIDNYWEDWRKQIRKAADEGKRSTTLTLRKDEGRLKGPDPFVARLMELGVELLGSKGFGAEPKSRHIEPSGSDPLYPNTMTFHEIDVSW